MIPTRQRGQEGGDRDVGDATWAAVAALLDGAPASLGRRDRQAGPASLHRRQESPGRGRVDRPVGGSGPQACGPCARPAAPFFERRGVTLGAAVLGTLLSTKALEAATSTLTPAAIAATASATAGAGGAIGSMAESLIWAMFWTKAKVAAVIVAAAVVLAGASAVPIYQRINAHAPAIARCSQPPAGPTQSVARPVLAAERIEGTVHGLDGEPLPGAEVFLCTPSKVPRTRRRRTAGATRRWSPRAMVDSPSRRPTSALSSSPSFIPTATRRSMPGNSPRSRRSSSGPGRGWKAFCWTGTIRWRARRSSSARSSPPITRRATASRTSGS